MAKKVAVLAVNPVNGAGLFQYLESFYENGIPYTVYAVADTSNIRSNSGVAVTVDGVVADLKGNEDKYDALVLSCGDAIPVFADNASRTYNQDMMEIIKKFSDDGKIIIGHCAAAMLFDIAGAVSGKRAAVHPLARPAIRGLTATGGRYEIDGNLFTAQSENTLSDMLPEVIAALR